MTTIVSKTDAAPFDRVKILLQCQNEIVKAGMISLVPTKRRSA